MNDVPRISTVAECGEFLSGFDDGRATRSRNDPAFLSAWTESVESVLCAAEPSADVVPCLRAFLVNPALIPFRYEPDVLHALIRTAFRFLARFHTKSPDRDVCHE